MDDLSNEVEKALVGGEEMYRSLLENMLRGFAYCRMHFDAGRPSNFTYVFVNRAFEELTGLRNVVGKRVTDVIPGISRVQSGALRDLRSRSLERQSGEI